MIKVVIILLMFMPFFLRAQNIQNLEKIILINNNIYQYGTTLDKADFIAIMKFPSTRMDTIYKHTSPKVGFERNPLCWDVINNQFIYLPIHTDSHKEPYAKLCYYVVDSLIQFSKNDDARLNSYLYSKSRFLSSVIPPFDKFKYRFDYLGDTIHRNPHLDFTCSKDSFLFYFYLPNQKALEIWQYSPFSRALGYTTVKVATRQKAWIKQREYKIDFSGPFRTFAANNKNYLITEDGRIMLITEDSINEKGEIPDLEQKVLVFDKDRNKLLTIEKGLLKSLKEPLSTENIYQHSKVVIDFDK